MYSAIMRVLVFIFGVPVLRNVCFNVLPDVVFPSHNVLNEA